MKFAHFFITRPIFATVISVVIVLLGGIAYFTLPVAQYPEIAPPTIVVSAQYPGASAQVVADTVAASGILADESPLRGIVASSESAAGLRGALVRGFTQGPGITLVLDDFQQVGDAQIQDDLHWLLQSSGRDHHPRPDRAGAPRPSGPGRHVGDPSGGTDHVAGRGR